MKNFCYLFYILFLSFYIQVSQATDYVGLTDLSDVQLSDVNITGPANLDNVKLSSARIIGALEFKKLSIAKDANIIGPTNGSFGKFAKLDVIGPLTLEDSDINSLNVVGSAHLKKVNIKSDSNIVGNLEAQKSHFQDITITAKTIKLSETKANNITIKDNSEEPFLEGEQVFELRNETIINGDVTFESKLGKILISKDSKINGKVIGAEIRNLEQ